MKCLTYDTLITPSVYPSISIFYLQGDQSCLKARVKNPSLAHRPGVKVEVKGQIGDDHLNPVHCWALFEIENTSAGAKNDDPLGVPDYTDLKGVPNLSLCDKRGQTWSSGRKGGGPNLSLCNKRGAEFECTQFSNF